MKNILFSIGIFVSCLTFAQQAPCILAYDLTSGRVDTLPIPLFDSTVTEDHTPHYLGNYNSQIATLSSVIPTNNVYPNTNYTYKRKASLDHDVTMYPLRTSVKLYGVYDGSLGHLCSGSMISGRHVLTATHCLFGTNSGSLMNDSLIVHPAFDNGTGHPSFGSSEVEKIYIFKDWSIFTNDIAVLELKDPLGIETGWISIGFDEDDQSLGQGIFHKFSYPALNNPLRDSIEYNGDTLFYSYGVVDYFSSVQYGVVGGGAVEGESGSSLTKVENGQKYISYGVLSQAWNIAHSRINNWKFYGLRSVIADDLSITGFPGSGVSELIVFPNPSHGEITLRMNRQLVNGRVTVHNLLGQQLSSQNIDSDSPHLQLPQEAGIYVITVLEGEEIVGRTKVIR